MSDYRRITLPADEWTRKMANSLGYAGAAFIPLVLGVAWIDPDFLAVAKRLAAIYGGVILGFLGGVQWGLALRSGVPRIGVRRLVASVLPSLWSVGAMTLPLGACLLMLLAGFVLFLAYESLERGDDVYPSWYLPLRTRLTACIAAGLALALLV